jgi:hypothetical protein
MTIPAAFVDSDFELLAPMTTSGLSVFDIIDDFLTFDDITDNFKDRTQ